MKLSFSTVGCPEWMLNEVLAAASDFGYDGVEIRGLGEDIFLPKAPCFGPKRLATSLREIETAHVAISCLSSDASCLLASHSLDVPSNIKAYIDLAVMIGAKNIRILADEWGPPAPNVDRELVRENMRHGEPIALPIDFLALALSELSSISERRIYQLVSGTRGLPSFLVAKPGLNSGFMIPQYTAAAIVSQNKTLCMPSSADSIPTSQGQEDHVSMGANGGTKLYRIVLNTERVLAIELLNAAQALEFRRPLKSSPKIERIFADYRQVVPFIEEDEVMYPHIAQSVEFLHHETID